jgi:4-amino-4-deoxy-L-arabinose transferase-like glycosyltransferase
LIWSFLKYPFTLSVKNQYYFLFALASLFFIPFLGHVHLFDWDEINFAESSREMLVSGDWFHVQINYEPFWEKPPLFFWIQSISMAIFGINEFGARFPNALFGIITLLAIYFIGKKHFSAKLGMTWAFVYAGSLLPHIYFRSGIIDPIFNLFIFLSVYHLLLNIKYNKSKNALYAG